LQKSGQIGDSDISFGDLEESLSNEDLEPALPEELVKVWEEIDKGD
jgi:hypothetical protein